MTILYKNMFLYAIRSGRWRNPCGRGSEELDRRHRSHRSHRCYRCYAGSMNPWSHEHPWRMKLCSGMLNSILIHLNSWFFSKLDFETFWVYNSTTFVALVTGVCKLASWSWAGQSQPTDVCGSWHCNGRFQAQLTTNAIPTSTSLALVHWYLALLFPQKMRCFSVWVCSLT